MLIDHLHDISHQISVLYKEFEDLFVSIAIDEEIVENKTDTLEELDCMVDGLHTASHCLHHGLQIFFGHLF